MADRIDGSENIAEDPQAEEFKRSKEIARQIVEQKLPLGMRGDIKERADRFRLDLTGEMDLLLLKALRVGGGKVDESCARVLGGVTLELCGLVIQEDIDKAKLELRLYTAPNSFDGKRVRIKIGQLRGKAAVVAEAARSSV